MSKLTQSIIVAAIIVIAILGIGKFVNFIQERNVECEGLGIETNCGDFSIGCAKDCIKLGQEYFKYEAGGFGSSSCICYLNKEVEQIW